MATCRGCGQAFQWGFCDGKWVPLEPIKTHDGLPRTYVDENGELRADHRDKHGPESSSVNVTRLDQKVHVPTHAPSIQPDEDLKEEADLEAAGMNRYGSLP